MSMPAEHISTRPDLATLLQGAASAPPIPLTGIASDSRLVEDGHLFLACEGERNHGMDYAADAVSAGAVAIAYDVTTMTEPPRDLGVPLIAIDNLAERLGELAHRFYGAPSEQLKVIGVTGTNGKSTVAWLIAKCFGALDMSCRYLGTLNHELTTPPAVELHGRLAEFRDAGAQYAAIEVSSHALTQGRVDGVRFDTALFTNLSRDHLDYHASMRDYAEAKARLFVECRPKHRLINLDTDFGAELAQRCGENVTTVSTNFDRVANGRPFVFVRAIVSRSGGSDVAVRSSWGEGRFSLAMPGEFNVANATIVLALLLQQGVSMETACEALSQAAAPPGRMQRVPASDNAPCVYIDFAHSPTAIEAVLGALRDHCRGRLWCVFGCGGERDSGKRPLMGRVAQRLSDHIVITSDNPRNEAPDAIVDDIVAGLPSPHAATVIEDRAAAIAWSIESAAPSDFILIAGTGHEQFQQVGHTRIAFSDYEVALAALQARDEEVSQ